VIKAHRLLYHSILASRVMKKKKKVDLASGGGAASDALGHGLRRVPRVHQLHTPRILVNSSTLTG